MLLSAFLQLRNPLVITYGKVLTNLQKGSSRSYFTLFIALYKEFTIATQFPMNLGSK